MMALQCPQLESQDALEGNAAHWVAALALQSFQRTGMPPDMQAHLEQSDPDGTTVTQDIIDSAEVYVQDVIFHCNKYGHLTDLLIEHGVRANYIHEECFGTMDTGLPLPTRIIIWDFKHGHGEVSPIWNTQMICYLAGLLCENPDKYGPDTPVEFRIAQPRCFTTDAPVRSFEFKLSDVWPHITRLAAAAEQALSEHAAVNAGPQCKYCPAVHRCSAMRKVEMFAGDFAGTPVPDALTVDGLSFELELLRRMLPILKSREEALEQEAIARAQGGEFIPGFVTERSVGKRKWLQPDAAIIEFGQAMELDLSGSTKAVTPAEAERRFKNAGYDPGLINTMAVAPVTGVKLVPASDSRARLAFSSTPR